MEIESRENEKKKTQPSPLVIQTLGNWRLFHIANLISFTLTSLISLKKELI